MDAKILNKTHKLIFHSIIKTIYNDQKGGRDYFKYEKTVQPRNLLISFITLMVKGNYHDGCRKVYILLIFYLGNFQHKKRESDRLSYPKDTCSFC